MKKCLIGCGQIIHDIDEHIDFTHPEKREGDKYNSYPVKMTQPPFSVSWDDFYINEETRERFEENYFSKVTLS